MIKILLLISCALGVAFAQPAYVDGVIVQYDDQVIPQQRLFTVLDSFPAGATNYSLGLGADGEFLWNNEAFLHWFARMDTATGMVVNSFSTTLGNRDMTFDGQYLWASDWQTSSISQFDTSNCTVINTYYPPFTAGRPNGMAWDSTHLWVGEESGRIYQMTLHGDTVRSIPPPVYYSYDPRGLAFDGEFLWVGYQSSGLIYKVDTITGMVVETNTAPGVVAGQRFQQGLAFDGQYLWSTVGGAVQMIYKIDIGIVGTSEQTAHVTDDILFNTRSNPVVNNVALQISITVPTEICLSIIDVNGRIINKVVQGQVSSGLHTYTWNTKNVPTGVYFATLETDVFCQTIKLIRIR